MKTFPFPDAETCYRLKAGAASVTRVTLASEDMAVPRDSEEYKQLYDNIGVVGSGTFGSVYCAVERETEEYVAAKYMIQQIEKVSYDMNYSQSTEGNPFGKTFDNFNFIKALFP